MGRASDYQFITTFCVFCFGILYNIRNQSATTEQFIIKAKETHGDKYDYDKVEYIKSKSKVIINCKHHGEFQQKPNSHLRGQGCPKCSAERIAISLTLTQEDFINRALKVHDNKYDYSLSEYKNSYVKIKIGCKEHGIFEQTPITHLQGQGCKECGMIKKNNKNTHNAEIFIINAKKVHGELYDYSSVNYTKSKK